MTLTSTMTIGGVRITPASLDDAVQDAISHATHHDGVCMRLTNTWCIVLADREPSYKELLNSTGENFADGRPVADEISKRSGMGNSHVRGQSFFEAVLDKGREAGLRHYFYGADDLTLARLTREIEQRYPGVTIAGRLAPPIATAEELCGAQYLDAIAAATPDIVWVGLGTPKQDIVATRVARELSVATAAVGAAFDFVAGTKQAAPEWMQHVKLEWLFRFASEPRRLWKRYTVGIYEYQRLMRRDLRRAA